MTWSIAANTFIWHSPLRDDNLRILLPKLKEWGFDGVELALENIGDWDPAFARDMLDETGLASVVGAVFGPGRELAATSQTTKEAGLAYMRGAIDAAAAQRSTMVIGPAYTSVGRTWALTDVERREIRRELIAVYRELGDYAAQRDVRIAIEPLNRYETSVFNTTAQLAEVIEETDHDHVGYNLDSYHMNIEERSFSEPIGRAGEKLFHIQLCGNDRGAPGNDITDWPTIFTALRTVNYCGMLGIESFTPENDTIAVAASIWRPLASSPDNLALDGLKFLTEMRQKFSTVDRVNGEDFLGSTQGSMSAQQRMCSTNC